MYAIFENGSKQYKVSVGDTVKVEKLAAEVGATVSFPVVMTADEKEKQGHRQPYTAIKITAIGAVEAKKKAAKKVEAAENAEVKQPAKETAQETAAAPKKRTTKKAAPAEAKDAAAE